MLSKKALPVEWTERSIIQIKSIQKYITNKFSEKEVAGSYDLLVNFEKTVTSFPKLYPTFSPNKKLHRAVLNKNLAIFYSIRSRKVIVVSVLDNWMDYSRFL